MWRSGRALLVSLLSISLTCGFCFAGDNNDDNGIDADLVEEEDVSSLAEEYVFPALEPRFSLSAGYRFVNLNGSSRADEYEYLHDSLIVGAGARVFSFPHRLDLDFDLKNKYDYFGDLSYSFKDLIFFRGVNRTLFHNLPHILLIDHDPSTPSPSVDVRDMNGDHGVRTGITNLFLRLKTPDFPFHVYAEGGFIESEGDRQQRSLLGSGYYNDIVRTSQGQHIDWKTKTLVIGTNSHVGPIEIDFAHGEKRFDTTEITASFDTYTPAGFPPGSLGPGGTFAHNLVPELKSSSNTLKIHSSYTGSIVVAATFSGSEHENRDSGARADYFLGAGEVTWIPMPRLVVALKYRHSEFDPDNPDTFTIADGSGTGPFSAYQVKAPLSSIADTVSATVRYRPVNGLSLRGEYRYDHIRRSEAEAWDVPDSSRSTTVSLFADMRLLKNTTLKAKYTHKDTDNPEYNTAPDRFDLGGISLLWTPLPQLSSLVSYDRAKGTRENLQFVNPSGGIFAADGDRSVTTDKFLGSITFILSDRMSCTASYSYFHNKTIQDIAYGDGISAPQLDPQVPYKETARNYSLDFLFSPVKALNLTAGVSYTLSEGAYYPARQDLTEPVSVASFSEFKTRETIISASGEYLFKNGLSVGLRYKYSNISDRYNSPDDDVDDGTVNIMALYLTKRW